MKRKKLSLRGGFVGYRIGSFNLKNLGFGALSNKNSRDIKKIAEIIRKERFDVVALQEILTEGVAFNLKNYEDVKNSIKRPIMMELGADWDFEWASADPKGASEDRRNEGYAYVWNKRRLRMSTVQLPDATERVFRPRMHGSRRMDMQRRPYYARFTPVGTIAAGPWVEFRLLCIHTYFGKDTKKDREKRLDELKMLMTDIYPEVDDRVYQGRMPHYTILLGDYNVEVKRAWNEKMRNDENQKRKVQNLNRIAAPATLQDEIIEFTKGGRKRIKTVQEERTTLKKKRTVEGIEDVDVNEFESDGYAHDYDHFSYEEKKFEGTGVKVKVKRIDAVNKYCGGNFEKYFKTVSDHVPIMMEIELR